MKSTCRGIFSRDKDTESHTSLPVLYETILFFSFFSSSRNPNVFSCCSLCNQNVKHCMKCLCLAGVIYIHTAAMACQSHHPSGAAWWIKSWMVFRVISSSPAPPAMVLAHMTGWQAIVFLKRNLSWNYILTALVSDHFETLVSVKEEMGL